MRTTQLIVVNQEKLTVHDPRQQVALFGPNGEPLLLKNDDISASQFNHLKGRVTKLENRLNELEG